MAAAIGRGPAAGRRGVRTADLHQRHNNKTFGRGGEMANDLRNIRNGTQNMNSRDNYRDNYAADNYGRTDRGGYGDRAGYDTNRGGYDRGDRYERYGASRATSRGGSPGSQFGGKKKKRPSKMVKSSFFAGLIERVLSDNNVDKIAIYDMLKK
jgi:hypothetical protein